MDLHPAQRIHAQRLIQALGSYGVALDASDPGVGKTYVASYIAKILRKQILVLAPKATLPAWQKISEGFGCRILTISNYEKLKTGKTEHLQKEGGRFKWNLPCDAMIIFDEAQRCKAMRSQNAELLIAAKQSGAPILLCSATAASNPLEMRAIGYSLQLHSLNNYWSWVQQTGCFQASFGWKFNNSPSHLKRIHRHIFPRLGSRLRIQDIPEFPTSHITSEAVGTGKEKQIQALYDQMKKELKETENDRQAPELNIIPGTKKANQQKRRELAKQMNAKRPSNMTITLRARQAIEFLKIPAMVEMTKDAINEAQSVVILVNFEETIQELARILHCHHLITGKQSREEVQGYIEEFQSNKAHLVIANIRAGGVGISLHDPRGERPRLALISPTYSAQDLKQALGRVHRTGGAHSTQKILFAAGTCEEETCKIVAKKLTNIELLNDGDLSS